MSGTDVELVSRDRLARDIAGEIVLAESPGAVLRKWRGIFKISQKRLASSLGITSSVISDYESGRRPSPGIRVIKRFVEALLRLDLEGGGSVLRSFLTPTQVGSSGAILDMREFDKGIPVVDFCHAINAALLVKTALERPLYGYTVIDSVRAITEFSFSELVRLYGTTTQRALVFTGVQTGRTPLVAIKLTGLHPALVVLHGLDVVDEVAQRIAEAEGIALAVSRLERVEDIIEKIRLVGK